MFSCQQSIRHVRTISRCYKQTSCVLRLLRLVSLVAESRSRNSPPGRIPQSFSPPLPPPIIYTHYVVFVGRGMLKLLAFLVLLVLVVLWVGVLPSARTNHHAAKNPGTPRHEPQKGASKVAGRFT